MKAMSNSFNPPSSAFVPSSLSKSVWAELTATAAGVAHRAVAFLTGEGYSEPRIQENRDRTGNVYFSVVDPITNQVQPFESEHEVRVWLENRYSR